MDAMSNPQPSPYGYCPAGQPPRPPAAGFFDSLRRTGLLRTRERWVGGVAGGVARRLGVDPVLVRCVWIVLCVFTGLGLLLYGLGWALLPEEEDGRIHAQQALTGDLTAGLAGSVIATIAGLSSTDHGLLPVWYLDVQTYGAIRALCSIAITVLIVYGIVAAVRRSRERRRRAAGWTQPQPGQPTPHAPATAAARWQSGPLPSTQSLGPTDATRTEDHGAPSGPAPAASAPSTSAPAAWSGTTTPTSGSRSVPAYPTPVAPGGTAPQSWAVPAPAPAPRPRRPRRPGPGRRTSLLVLGLVLLAVAGCGAAAASGALGPVGAGLLAAGAVVAGLGLGVLVSGLRGRRGGWMSWVAWPVVLLLGLPALAVGTLMPASTVNAPVATGDVVLRPTTSELEGARQRTGSRTVDLGRYSAGTVTLDLTGLDASPTTTTIAVTVGVGSLHVRTAEGQSVEVRATSTLGGAGGTVGPGWAVKGARTSSDVYDGGVSSEYDADGTTFTRTWIYPGAPFRSHVVMSSPAARAAAGPDVIVEATTGGAAIDVTEAQRHATWEGAKYDGYWVVGSWTDSRGRPHDGDSLPVEGMTHRAVSADALQTCISTVLPDSTTDDGFYVSYTDLGSLTAGQRAKVDDCVDEAITTGGGTTATTVPTDAPAPSASASASTTH